MPFAFTHLITGWLIGKTFEKVSKKNITHNGWFFLLLGSILPDFDFIINYTTNIQFHRTFTHSLLFVILAFIIPYSVLYFTDKKNAPMFAIFLSIGTLVHILLDSILLPGIPYLWPHVQYFSLFNFTFPYHYFVLEDMYLGVIWIFFLWWRKKIKF